MYSRSERHTAFAVISSFLLKVAADEFPIHCEFEIEEIKNKAIEDGASFFFDRYSKLIVPTIEWLSDEGFIRHSSEGSKFKITLTKLGAESINLKLEKTGQYLSNFLRQEDNEYLTMCSDSFGFDSRERVKITSPALDFIPKGWLS